MDASDQASFPDVTGLPQEPRVPDAVPTARPSVKSPGPSFAALLRGVLVMAAAVALVALTGLRWARAFERFPGFPRGGPFSPLWRLRSRARRAPAVAAPAGAAAKQPRAVAFHLEAPEAKAVLLGGSFNGFDAGGSPMTRRPDGAWEAVLTLPPGRYFYKFKVDGRWTLDPSNPERTSGAREALSRWTSNETIPPPLRRGRGARRRMLGSRAPPGPSSPAAGNRSREAAPAARGVHGRSRVGPLGRRAGAGSLGRGRVPGRPARK